MSAKELTPEQRESLERHIEHKIRRKATRRVHSKLGLMWHFAVFAMVNLALVAINLQYSPDYLWFIWVLGAWGSGFLLHAFATFSSGGLTEEMIQAEILREKERRGLL